MTATKTTAKVIGLWLDETSDSDRPAWIVSRDRMNANGEAETTDTMEWRNLDDYDDAYEQAKEVALELARKDGLCVIQTEANQSQTCIYAPKTIIICDGIGHSRAEYRLHGSTLEMTQSGGCNDALNDNGCDVNDEMDDDDIIEAVRESWTGEGYDGDPDENGLTISVTTEKSIIER